MEALMSWSWGDGGCWGSIGIGHLAVGLRVSERWLGARRELEGGLVGS